MSNIQKLFSERIEIFSAVEFSKVSILTGIVKISLKVSEFQVAQTANLNVVSCQSNSGNTLIQIPFSLLSQLIQVFFG